MAVPARLTRLFGLHGQVALVALVLLVIPWVGYSYVKAMEKLLRQNQEQQVVAAARGIATALQDRPRLLALHGASKKITDIVPDAPPAPVQTQPQPQPQAQAEGEAPKADAELEPPKPLPPPPPEAVATSASEEVRVILAGLARAGLRIWVVDSQLRLVATAGSLEHKTKSASESASFGPLEKLVHAALQPLFRRMFPPPPVANEEFIPNDVVFGGKELERALDGTPGLRRRAGAQGRTAILSAAHPIWVGDKVVGAAIVEENTDAIVSLGNRALEQLAAVTLIAFAAVALVLLLFASRLSWRLRRLRDEAENAIDSQGHMNHGRGLVTAEHANDEIGDLSRAFSTMLERLAQYHAHLEKLAQRLSHELRTPIAVVRSSLDNLKLQAMPAGTGVYLERAEGGLNRLETILTRMAEATRLEQAVRNEERAPFNAKAVLAGCVSGYAAAYPHAKFELAMSGEPVTLTGAPDLFAQMLDKLAANAADFATAGTPINVSLQRLGGDAVIQFSNSGPPLPSEIAERLFDSMISVRKSAANGDNPHLGLGLYIVRLIAEFHGGRASARNWDNGGGVTFAMQLPAVSTSNVNI